jgi:spoIIIJ-associated protein
MERTMEFQAKTIEAAVEMALAHFKCAYDEVDIEVMSSGGFLKKAKIVATLKKGAALPVVEKKEEAKREEPKREEVKKEVPVQVAKKADAPAPKKDVPAPRAQEPKKVVTRVDGEMPKKFEMCLDFTKKLLEELGNDSTVKAEETEKGFNIQIEGENVGMIIGKGGEVLNAIQTLVSSIAIANSAGENKRVYVNINDYKERRDETLKGQALRKAEKVKETGRYIKLDPMSARERAIIHSALQEVEGIRTYSTGKDPHRCLCIAPAKKDGEA